MSVRIKTQHLIETTQTNLGGDNKDYFVVLRR